MSLLPVLIVAWAVVIPAAVVGAFSLASRARRAAVVLPPQAARPVVSRRTCETRRRKAVVADSRRFLRHHG
jgi:hypothetical protein